MIMLSLNPSLGGVFIGSPDINRPYGRFMANRPNRVSSHGEANAR
ncbi:hypothetical protein TPY_1469 [Sulfobacillus acidophilus TPY]|nr:hypothetical protein TPY_1469 [Sulfobacillus acidophilus TPY]